jgi:hypothetical protein
MEKKRKLSNRYRLANIRKKRWKEDRDHMESIRLRAISKAKFNKDIHSVRLADFISLWPERLTTQQLNENIKAQINLTNSSVKSFKEYLTRRKILRYDAMLGKWINLTLLQLPQDE